MFFSITSTLAMVLLGSLSASLLLSRLRGWTDPRTAGSGNAGATNMLRVHGRMAGLLVFLLDAGKAALALWLGGLFAAHSPLPLLCQQWLWLFAVVLGHIYPVFFAFRGGKGMAPFIGGVLFLQPQVALLIFLLVLPVLAGYRRSSAATLLALLLYLPLGMLVTPVEALDCQWRGAAATLLLILWAHRSNIHRLLHGQEPTF